MFATDSAAAVASPATLGISSGATMNHDATTIRTSTTAAAGRIRRARRA